MGSSCDEINAWRSPPCQDALLPGFLRVRFLYLTRTFHRIQHIDVMNLSFQRHQLDSKLSRVLVI